MYWNNNLVYKAVFFAEAKHKSQFMKHPEGIPYSAHFYSVALNAVKYAMQLNEKINWDLLVCCAILHDVVEDTQTSIDEIKDNFGIEIANGVQALTKNEKIEKSLQMKDSIERIKKQPKEVAIVKMSDRLFNIRDRVPFWSKEKIEKYYQESKYIIEQLGDACSPIKEELEILAENYLID